MNLYLLYNIVLIGLLKKKKKLLVKIINDQSFLSFENIL